MATAKGKSTAVASKKAEALTAEGAKQLGNQLILDVEMELHALLDIALRLPEIRLEGSTLTTMLQHLARALRQGFEKFEQQLPDDHEAHFEVDKVISAAEGIEMLAIQVRAEEAGANHKMTDEALGRCLYGFALDAGFALDNAREAIGHRDHVFKGDISADYYEQVRKQNNRQREAAHA